MKPSDRVKDLLPECVKVCTERARQLATTNSFAPTVEEFEEILKLQPHQHLAVIVEAYATAMLTERDEEQERRLAWEKRVDNHMDAVSALPIWPSGSRT